MPQTCSTLSDNRNNSNFRLYQMKENISVLVLAESEMAALCGISVSPNFKNTQALILSGFTYGIFDKLPKFFKKMAISLNYIKVEQFLTSEDRKDKSISRISDVFEQHFDIIIASGEENISLISDFICATNRESQEKDISESDSGSDSSKHKYSKGDAPKDTELDTKLICLSKQGKALEVCDLMLVQSNFANTKLCDNIAYFGELIGKNISFMLPYKQQICDTISSLESPRIGLFVGENDPFFKPDRIVSFAKSIIKLVKEESGSLVVSINKNVDEKIAEIFRSAIDGEIDFYIKKDCESYDDEIELQDISLFKSVDKVIASSLSLEEMSIMSCFHKTIHIPESKQKNKALLEAMGFNFLDMDGKVNINGGRETKINDIEAIQARILKTLIQKTPAKMNIYHELTRQEGVSASRNIISQRKIN